MKKVTEWLQVVVMFPAIVAVGILALLLIAFVRVDETEAGEE
jgi:hypothetical protein